MTMMYCNNCKKYVQTVVRRAMIGPATDIVCRNCGGTNLSRYGPRDRR